MEFIQAIGFIVLFIGTIVGAAIILMSFVNREGRKSQTDKVIAQLKSDINLLFIEIESIKVKMGDVDNLSQRGSNV